MFSCRVFSLFAIISNIVSVSTADRDSMNIGKNCRDALSFSLLHQQNVENFGHKFATESDAKFIVQIILEDIRTQSIKAKCTGSLLNPKWVITSSDCGRDFRQGMSLPAHLTFKVFTGIDFGDTEDAKVTSGPKDVYDVSRVMLVSHEDTVCSPMLLFLDKPIHHKAVVCLTHKSIPYHRKLNSNKPIVVANSSSLTSRGLALGWSTFGDSVVERVLRISGVRVEKSHCLSNQDHEDLLYCVTYNPQVHFYLLAGSPLLTVKDPPGRGQKEVFLEGIACSNLSSHFVNSGFLYRQTYLRLSYFLTAIQGVTGEDSIIYYTASSPSRLPDSMTFGFLVLVTIFMTIFRNIPY